MWTWQDTQFLGFIAKPGNVLKVSLGQSHGIGSERCPWVRVMALGQRDVLRSESCPFVRIMSLYINRTCTSSNSPPHLSLQKCHAWIITT